MKKQKKEALILENQELREKLKRLQKNNTIGETSEKVFTKPSLNLDFTQVMEACNVGIILLSCEGVILAHNSSAKKILSAAKKKLIDHSLQDHIFTKQNIEFAKRLDMVLSEESNEQEFTIELKNNAWVVVHLKAIEKSGSNDKHILCQLNNISDQKLAEEKFIDQHHLILQLINSIPDNIFIKDVESRFILANNWVAKLMGVSSPEELLGKTDYDFYPKDLADKYFKDEKDILNSGNGKLNMIEKVLSVDKEICWYSTTKIPLEDNDGKIIGIVGIGRDITQTIHERQNLNKAKEAAEKADRLKTAFLANISHEIRTPLNGIIGFSQFLRQSELAQKDRAKYLDLILKNGKQLLRLITEIIDISMIESGQLSIKNKNFELNQLLKQIKYVTENELQHKQKPNLKISLKCGLNNQESLIHSDDFRIRQVLTNLINNAIKFTDEGEVCFGYNMPEKGRIKFFVSDTGIGIPPDLFKTIFKQFRQADDSKTRKYGGTGLGLSVSQGLVKLLNGKIWVESEEGKGSVFYFTIPYKKPDLS